MEIHSSSSTSFLTYLDLSIIYLFFIFQMTYNTLTFIKIKQSKNKVSILKLILSYFFWTYPIIYSIYPIILSFESSFDFGLFMIYLRIPPTVLSALLIIVWSIYIPIHNKEVNTLKNISESSFTYSDAKFDIIQKSHNIFKKHIVKINDKFIDRVDDICNIDEAIKIVAEAQGWFIGKDKFSWMWLHKRKNTQNFYKQVFENICFSVQVKIKSLE